jgi:hypothetical protein
MWSLKNIMIEADISTLSKKTQEFRSEFGGTLDYFEVKLC